MEYKEKLKDPRWQKKRLEILKRDNWCCQSCFDPSSMLIVHHLKYIFGKEPWDYPNETLLTLCESCHLAEHELKEQFIEVLIEQIKNKGFLSNSIREIAIGISDLNMIYPEDVMASIIKFALSSDIFNIISTLFFDKINSKE